jgi:predicted negative regulator of RcsB-dependent stress response
VDDWFRRTLCNDRAIAALQQVTQHPLADWKVSVDKGGETSYRALAYNLLGEIYKFRGKSVEARQQFEAAIRADKNFQTPHNHLATLEE